MPKSIYTPFTYLIRMVLARLGKHHSEETLIKLKNRVHSDETRKKIGLAHKGKSLSEEHKQKISKSLKHITY